MKLRDISLSIYYEPYVYGIYKNQYDSESKYLIACREYYHENIFPIDKQFLMETRNIASFFSRLYYENYKNAQYPFRKLIVSCCRDEHNIGKITDYDGIAEVKVLYDYTEFKSKNIIQKKCDALHIIMDGLSKVACEYSLDITPYRFIESMIISSEYKNIWIWKSKWNKNRKYNAIVYIDHDVQQVIIGLKIEDKDGGLIDIKELVVTKPDEWDYSFFLGKLFWQSNYEVILLDKKNGIVGKWLAQ